MSFESQEEALSALEEARADWLAMARASALEVANQKGFVTVDDIHRTCPVPKGIDGRVMGAVFNTADFEAGDFVLSSRKICHGRPIRRFVLAGAAV